MMKKESITNNNIETIIAKIIDKRATAEEVVAVDEWRETSINNEESYQNILKLNGWYSDMSSHAIDTDNAWKKLSLNIKTENPEKETQSKASWYKYMAYAATIIMVVGALMVMSIDNQSNSSPIVATHTESNHLLDDGSNVTLKSNSALNLIANSDREYNFAGAAKFVIVHDEHKPFVIHIEEVIIKDLGTVFDVEARPKNDTVFVKVTEGVVQFYTKSDEGIMLEQGEEGMYIKSKNKFYKRSIDISNPILSVVFHDATLGEVIDHLAYSFRKTILMNNQDIRNCNLTVDFTKAPYVVVKEIIEETLDVSIEESDNTLTFSGEGCQK